MHLFLRDSFSLPRTPTDQRRLAEKGEQISLIRQICKLIDLPLLQPTPPILGAPADIYRNLFAPVRSDKGRHAIHTRTNATTGPELSVLHPSGAFDPLDGGEDFRDGAVGKLVRGGGSEIQVSGLGEDTAAGADGEDAVADQGARKVGLEEAYGWVDRMGGRAGADSTGHHEDIESCRFGEEVGVGDRRGHGLGEAEIQVREGRVFDRDGFECVGGNREAHIRMRLGEHVQNLEGPGGIEKLETGEENEQERFWCCGRWGDGWVMWDRVAIGSIYKISSTLLHRIKMRHSASCCGLKPSG